LETGLEEKKPVFSPPFAFAVKSEIRHHFLRSHQKKLAAFFQLFLSVGKQGDQGPIFRTFFSAESDFLRNFPRNFFGEKQF
jgi:hypothetical protein